MQLFDFTEAVKKSTVCFIHTYTYLDNTYAYICIRIRLLQTKRLTVACQTSKPIACKLHIHSHMYEHILHIKV